MKSYINTLADYRETPFEREVSVACPEEHVKAQMKHLTRKFKRTEAVTVLEKGDVAVLSLSSVMEKFNRPSVFITVGGGLFHRGFEEALAGHAVGESFAVMVDGEPVQVLVKQASRTMYPEPTDEMAAAYAREKEEFAGIATVEQYRHRVEKKYIDEKTDEILYKTIYDIIEYVLTHSDWEFDDGELEDVMKEEMEYIQQELKEENKEFATLSGEEFMEYFGAPTSEEAEKVIKSAAEQRIAQALWQAFQDGIDTEKASLEELEERGSWDFLENYVKENLRFL